MIERELQGRVALVTGASKGLGKAVSLALAKAGACLALVSRDRSLLEEVAGDIRTIHGECEIFPADVGDEEQVRMLERDTVARFGGVDILVNNAGINIRKKITDFTLEEWEQVLRINLTGVFLTCRAFVPHMKGRDYGRILNVTSIMSHVALPERTAYASSKAGLLGLTRALALELASEGITVNGISPGPIATEMNRSLLEDPELSRQFLSRIPLRRWGRAEEIGSLVVFLCSRDAGFITGTDILMDGGWCAQ